MSSTTWVQVQLVWRDAGPGLTMKCKNLQKLDERRARKFFESARKFAWMSFPAFSIKKLSSSTFLSKCKHLPAIFSIGLHALCDQCNPQGPKDVFHVRLGIMKRNRVIKCRGGQIWAVLGYFLGIAWMRQLWWRQRDHVVKTKTWSKNGEFLAQENVWRVDYSITLFQSRV